MASETNLVSSTQKGLNAANPDWRAKYPPLQEGSYAYIVTEEYNLKAPNQYNDNLHRYFIRIMNPISTPQNYSFEIFNSTKIFHDFNKMILGYCNANCTRKMERVVLLEIYDQQGIKTKIANVLGIDAVIPRAGLAELVVEYFSDDFADDACDFSRLSELDENEPDSPIAELDSGAEPPEATETEDSDTDDAREMAASPDLFL